MSIELLPFSAFALETCTATQSSPSEGETLTLSLRRGRVPDPAAGWLMLEVALNAALDSARAGQHAGVARDAVVPLTITF